MEFHDVGAHCALDECRQLDFLPFKCNGCGERFCSAHRRPSTHRCSNPPRDEMVVPVCPLCEQVIPLRAGESADDRVDAHIAAGCQKETATVVALRKKRCAARRCHASCAPHDLYSCKSCREQFCIKHRFAYQHKCNSERRATRGCSAESSAGASVSAAGSATSASAGGSAAERRPLHELMGSAAFVENARRLFGRPRVGRAIVVQ